MPARSRGLPPEVPTPELHAQASCRQRISTSYLKVHVRVIQAVRLTAPVSATQADGMLPFTSVVVISPWSPSGRVLPFPTCQTLQLGLQ